MRRIFGMIAVLALVVAFAMPVVTADAASHEKNPCAAKEKMKEGAEKMKEGAANPCKAKKQ
ncbi:MAG: hypothetical protein ETSY1_04215 [Candidatus Entotheonella factor]|uniref:Uncharacterized protein n=1 Tax=Entotheonella factor TaxID=1429438 RepID=W4LWL2_ENTF1|nr:hypothetical protein [Candidatus Entotheonella palauensis]ETX02273.1 MAG: hypothetical protein ETSY1_04215 [Candidatus Entotheonella factor]